jgi:hypothetical protein
MEAYQTASGERPRRRAEATLPLETLSRQYPNLLDRARDHRQRQEVTQQGASTSVRYVKFNTQSGHVALEYQRYHPKSGVWMSIELFDPKLMQLIT